MFIYVVKDDEVGERTHMNKGAIHITRDPASMSYFYASIVLEIDDETGEVYVRKDGLLPVWDETAPLTTEA